MEIANLKVESLGPNKNSAISKTHYVTKRTNNDTTRGRVIRGQNLDITNTLFSDAK